MKSFSSSHCLLNNSSVWLARFFIIWLLGFSLQLHSSQSCPQTQSLSATGHFAVPPHSHSHRLLLLNETSSWFHSLVNSPVSTPGRLLEVFSDRPFWIKQSSVSSSEEEMSSSLRLEVRGWVVFLCIYPQPSTGFIQITVLSSSKPCLSIFPPRWAFPVLR